MRSQRTATRENPAHQETASKPHRHTQIKKTASCWQLAEYVKSTTASASWEDEAQGSPVTNSKKTRPLGPTCQPYVPGTPGLPNAPICSLSLQADVWTAEIREERRDEGSLAAFRVSSIWPSVWFIVYFLAISTHWSLNGAALQDSPPRTGDGRGPGPHVHREPCSKWRSPIQGLNRSPCSRPGTSGEGCSRPAPQEHKWAKWPVPILCPSLLSEATWSPLRISQNCSCIFLPRWCTEKIQTEKTFKTHTPHRYKLAVTRRWGEGQYRRRGLRDTVMYKISYRYILYNMGDIANIL